MNKGNQKYSPEIYWSHLGIPDNDQNKFWVKLLWLSWLKYLAKKDLPKLSLYCDMNIGIELSIITALGLITLEKQKVARRMCGQWLIHVMIE